MFMPNVAADLAKKSLGPKSVWIPVVENANKVCAEHGNNFKTKKKKTIC